MSGMKEVRKEREKREGAGEGEQRLRNYRFPSLTLPSVVDTSASLLNL